ncbi:RNA polymerase sigma factor [Saccharopolyspora gregorii]|uniref:RNA polymerase sigma factor n=1 Tax=Saccharopolyspora gregorii TaxID=33914 RepID=UPI0021ABC4CC|nr:RNA polymerase sigma factor [Saccharopolyspora gregorii]
MSDTSVARRTVARRLYTSALSVAELAVVALTVFDDGTYVNHNSHRARVVDPHVEEPPRPVRRPFPGSPSIVEAPSERHRRQQATTRRDPGAPAFRAGGMTAAVRVPQPLTGDAAWELVERAQRGDRIAFGRLYERYRPLVSNFLCARIHDFSTVEDLVHETFARALHNIRTVRRGSDDPGAWFVTIARHLLLDHLKSARNRREVVTADFDPDRRSADALEDLVLDRLMADRLWSRAGDLSDDQHRCLVLRFALGLTVEQTASRMGRDGGAVRALQYRAVRRLGALLREDCWEHVPHPR